MIFDIGEYIIMEWTMPNESRLCRICRRVLILKKEKKSIAGGSCTYDHQAYVVRRTFLITKIGGP